MAAILCDSRLSAPIFALAWLLLKTEASEKSCIFSLLVLLFFFINPHPSGKLVRAIACAAPGRLPRKPQVLMISMSLTWVAILASLLMGVGALLIFILAVKEDYFRKPAEIKYQVF